MTTFSYRLSSSLLSGASLPVRSARHPLSSRNLSMYGSTFYVANRLQRVRISADGRGSKLASFRLTTGVVVSRSLGSWFGKFAVLWSSFVLPAEIPKAR